MKGAAMNNKSIKRKEPIVTDKIKKYCGICGTYTIDKYGCHNINHIRNLDLFIEKTVEDSKIIN